MLTKKVSLLKNSDEGGRVIYTFYKDIFHPAGSEKR